MGPSQIVIHNGAVTIGPETPASARSSGVWRVSDIHVKNVASPVAVTATGDLTGRALDGGLFGLPFPSVGAPRLEARDGRSTRGR